MNAKNDLALDSNGEYFVRLTDFLKCQKWTQCDRFQRGHHSSSNPILCYENILQNSPYFYVFKYARTVKQKVWARLKTRARLRSDAKNTLALPWVPEVLLACGGNFRCWPKADTSSAVWARLSPSSRSRHRICRRTATCTRFRSSRKHYIAQGNNAQDCFGITGYRVHQKIRSQVQTTTRAILSRNQSPGVSNL